MLIRMALCRPCLQWTRSQLAAAHSSHVSSLVGLCCSMHCFSPKRLATLQGSTHCLMKPEKWLQWWAHSHPVCQWVKSLQLLVGSQTPWPQPQHQQEDAGGTLIETVFPDYRVLSAYPIQGHYLVQLYCCLWILTSRDCICKERFS